MMQRQDNIIDRWTAEQHGLKPFNHVEYIVKEISLKNGGAMQIAEFFKPFASTRPGEQGQKKPSFGFAISKLSELVDRINDVNMKFGSRKGVWVFQPAPAHMGNVPSPQQPQFGYGQGQPQQPQPNYSQGDIPFGGLPQGNPGGYNQGGGNQGGNW